MTGPRPLNSLSPRGVRSDLPYSTPAAQGRSRPVVTTIRPPQTSGRVIRDRQRGQRSPSGNGVKLASASAIMVLFLALAGVVGGTWIGLASILSPESMAWLGPLLPQKRQVTDQDLLALDDIRAIAAQYQFSLGEITSLDEEHILIPFLALAESCSVKAGQCRQIRELRVYRLDKTQVQGDRLPRYRQTVRLEIDGPAESFVLSPWTLGDRQGSNQPLPLGQVVKLNRAAPEGGHWLTVSGRHHHGKATSLYGKVLRYNPETGHLAELLQWHSPGGQFPRWSQITGDGAPELIVDASTALNPDFRIYEVTDLAFEPNPVTLAPISLRESVVNLPLYNQALNLAQGKLWSQAHQSLTRLHDQLEQQRSPDSQGAVWEQRLQAQYDVIHYHAMVAQAKSDSQRTGSHYPVIAALADGQWQRAWDRWQDSGDRGGLVNGLSSHGELLWSRIETQLRVDSSDPLVTVWGALLLSAKRGRPAAIAWYRQQKRTNSDLDTQVDQALAQLESLETLGPVETVKAPAPQNQAIPVGNRN
ncbi:MAG: hypothetical protein AAF889_09960 [Cyanobacteria bacterium P01_D01_bin.73]